MTYLAFLLIAASLARGENSDATADFQKLCTENGFQAEQHTVTTSDGYILTMFRIPGLLNETHTAEKQPLLLHHGLIDSSDTWVVNDADLCPAFIFAKAGYDVWLGNMRGNKYALSNTHLSVNSHEFWQFSWQEFSEYDLPADIDYILGVTGFKKLTYMGHSQGTLGMFALLADQPEIADKINSFVAVGPVGTVRNLTAKIITDVADTKLIEYLEALGVNQFLPDIHTPNLFYYFCKLVAIACEGGTMWLADMEISEDNLARFPVIFAHEPGGTSMMNMQYWQQMTQYSDYRMQKFDYGTSGNMKKYGQATPPLYDLSKIRAPIAAYFGKYDELADPIDGAWLRSQLEANKNIPELHIEDGLDKGHLTFMWGKDMSYLNDVMKFINKWIEKTPVEAES